MINIGTRAKQKTLRSGEFRFALFKTYCLWTKKSQTWSLAIKVKPKIVSCDLGFHILTISVYQLFCGASSFGNKTFL